MYCGQCGNELGEDQQFCPKCGCSREGQTGEGESRKEHLKVLFRRAASFSEQYNVEPDLTGLSGWEMTKIEEFDPSYRILAFKKDLIQDLMEFSKYQCSVEEIEKIAERIYPDSRKLFLNKLKMFFLKKSDEFKAETKGKFVYGDKWSIDNDVRLVYAYSRFMFLLDCELKNWEGLKFTMQFLSCLQNFRCDPKGEYEVYGLEKRGKMFRLRQFSHYKAYYDELMDMIREKVVLFNPQEKEAMEADKKKSDKKTRLINKPKSEVYLRESAVLFCFP